MKIYFFSTSIMSFEETSFLFTFFTIILACKASSDVLIDFPEKCGIRDGECQKNMMTTLFSKYAETGIESLGIPRVNPYKVENTTVSILQMSNMTMTDGLVEGASQCSLLKIETDIEERFNSAETFCESLKISGRYVTEFGPLAQAIIGNTFIANGNGFIQIDKMTLKTKIPFNVEKLEDGKIYLIPKVNEAEYSTDDIGNISFGADKLLFGGIDTSKPLINFMNNNWKMILKSFGRFYSDKMMETFYGYLSKFFPAVPASNFIKDDLTPYVMVRRNVKVIEKCSFQ